MPFFIDWLECTNPRDTNPHGGEFQSLTISTGNAADLQGTLAAIDLDLNVTEGEPAISVHIETPRGELRAPALVLATNAYSNEMEPGLAPRIARQVVPVLRLSELRQSLQFLWRPTLRSMQRIEACAVGRED